MTKEKSEKPTQVEQVEEEAKHRRDDFGAHVHRRVEHMLKTRSAREGTLAARVEEKFKRRASRLWSAMKRRPSVGVIAAGTAGITAASFVGVGELVIGLSAAYAAYAILKEHMKPDEAVKKGIVLIDEAAR